MKPENSVYGPQGKWSKEVQRVNERASRGPVKNWTANQRVEFVMELLAYRVTNAINTTYCELSTAMEVGAGECNNLPTPFDGYENLKEALEDLQEQVHDLMLDLRALGQYARDHKNKKGLFQECPSPTATNMDDPLSLLLATGPAIPS